MSEIVKVDIRNLNQKQLQEALASFGEPKYRVGQIEEWLWKKSATNFEEMSNLSKSLRATLDENFCINPIKEDARQTSKDGTVKLRYKLHDGHLIEAVLIPQTKDDRYTVCVSSQVGCSLSCSFCATGQMDRIRNLDPGEIYDQVVLVNEIAIKKYNHPLTNIVYMGMGEPLLAYNNVMESIYRLTDEKKGLHYSAKRITVSTAGISKMIRKMADDNLNVNLALSLHAADDEKRNTIMPINEQNDLDSLVEAISYFYEKTNNKISYEYIAFQNFNDSIEDAKALLRLCQKYPVKVNIIEYNPIDGADFKKADAQKIDDFALYLKRNNVMTTIRRSRGKDIDAACGQLAIKAKNTNAE